MMRFVFAWVWRARWSCVLLALAAAQAAAQDPLRIGRNAGPSAMLADGSEQVLKTAYARLGVSTKFEEYPLLRSLVLADAGMIDGDNMRIVEVTAQYPNLVRVDVPVNHVEITAYALAPCPHLKDWTDLDGKRVGHIRGVLAVERRLGRAVPVAADNMSDLFRMLEKGMVDVAVGTGRETDGEMRRRNDKRLCKVNGVLERVPLYHHLNKKHAALAARLTEELRQMQARGEIEEILKRVNAGGR
ncbi:substrate-binding periplasmic protein [Piscinibacter terrae]|nr:transporter substrate-binding domain-containing protein [Albitalea terrae]